MGTDLTEDQRKTLTDMLFRNYKVFSTNRLELGKCTNMEHKIHADSHVTPIALHPYRVCPKQMPAFREEIINLIKDGIIEPSNTSWRSLVMLVPKKDQFSSCDGFLLS